jgi:hypothetical protein
LHVVKCPEKVLDFWFLVGGIDNPFTSDYVVPNRGKDGGILPIVDFELLQPVGLLSPEDAVGLSE